MSKRPREWADAVVPAAVAVFTALAVWTHLQYAASTNFIAGKDWILHVIGYHAIGRVEPNPARILAWYLGNPLPMVHYPPLGYLGTSVWRRLGMEAPGCDYAVKAWWIVVLVGSLYGAGRRLAGSTWGGLAAAVIAGLSGSALGQARRLDLEFQQVSAVAATLYFYLRTDRLSRGAASALFGLVAGLAVLVKPHAAFYFAPFVAIDLLLDRPPGIPWTRRAARLVLAAGIAAAIAAPYYVPLLPRVLYHGVHDLSGPAVDPGNSAVAYLTILRRGGVVAPLVAALGLGLSAVGLARGDRFPIAVLGASFAVLGVFSFRDVQPEYIGSLSVFGALLCARGLRHVGKRAGALVAFLLAACYAAPLLAPAPADAFQVRHTDNPVVRFLYPGPVNGLREIAPHESDQDDWSTIAVLAKLFSTRYADVPGSRMAAVNAEKIELMTDYGLANLLNTPLGLSWDGAGEFGSFFHAAVISSVSTTEPLSARLQFNPLVVVALPARSAPDPGAAFADLNRTHRLDLRLDLERSPFCAGAPLRLLFLRRLRPSPDPA